MTASELKQHILEGDEFPDLPPAARDVLRWSADDAVDVRAVAGLLAVDDSMRRALAAAAGFPAATAPPLEDIAGALGASRFRRLLLAYSCVQMFPPGRDVRVDRHAFWSHALTCGTMSEDLTRRVGGRHLNDAFAAGLLLDVGKLAIDQCIAQGYGKVHAMARAKGLYVLEAERLELGVDHALVGKWVTERWGMSESVVLCTWLHHHDAAGLDAELFPVDLIEVVELAELLAHRRASGQGRDQRVSDAFEERRRHLNLGIGDLDAVMRTPAEPLLELARSMSTGGDEPQDTNEHPRLLREARRYKGLYDFMVCAATARNRADVLTHAAEALRSGYDISAGTCFALDESGEKVDGVLWRAEDTAPKTISTTLSEAEPAATAAGALQALLRAVGGAEDGGRALRRATGLVAIPLNADGEALGQIVFDAAVRGSSLDDGGMADLLRFARACGEALRSRDTAQAREARSEMLAASLLRQELNYRQSLREERLASIGRMAAGAAHEINNPLAVIAGSAQILLSRASSPEDAKALETIIQQSRRAGKILIDLMQFARPGRPKLESAPIGQCMHQVVSMLADRLKAKNIRIVEDYARDVPLVRIDRHQMEQVFLNLIVNAEQAMEAKGGTLSLRVWHMSRRNTVVVQVSDTGHGIPTDRLDRVFEPFFSAREEGKGSGLGLAVCHGIVENHRGSITVHSVPGEGTTLTISLPATAERVLRTPRVVPAKPAGKKEERTPVERSTNADGTLSRFRPPEKTPSAHTAESRPKVAATGATRGEGGGACVLIADKDDALREVLKESLRGRGFEVITATDGLEALASFLGGGVDLILLDIHLPAVDGTTVLQQIRQRHGTVPIIGFADRLTEAELEQAERLGLAVCLRKPFEMRELLRHVTQALGSRSVA